VKASAANSANIICMENSNFMTKISFVESLRLWNRQRTGTGNRDAG
jgi:hypothetical protein